MSSSISAKPTHHAVSSSDEETRAIARRLGERLSPGDWVALTGDLGAGKTCFVQGLAEGLHCGLVPSSPTFALVQVYPAGPKKAPLRHVDLYRLSPKDVPALEWEDLTDDLAVTAVEWAEKARQFWPAHAVEVRLTHDGENRRRVEFFSGHPRAADILKAMGKGKS